MSIFICQMLPCLSASYSEFCRHTVGCLLQITTFLKYHHACLLMLTRVWRFLILCSCGTDTTWAVNVGDSKCSCDLVLFCVFTEEDTCPKVVFSFPESSELFSLRSRRSLWKCWRRKHRARSQSKSICSFNPINESSAFFVSFCSIH